MTHISHELKRTTTDKEAILHCVVTVFLVMPLCRPLKLIEKTVLFFKKQYVIFFDSAANVILNLEIKLSVGSKSSLRILISKKLFNANY